MTNPDPGNANQDDAALRLFERKLDEARKELLDSTTRSRLLDTPRDSARAKIIDVKDELSDEVFRILVRESREMFFAPAPHGTEEDEAGQVNLLQPEDDDPTPAGPARRHADSKLQTALVSSKLQSRLRSISYDAQTFENEQGVNTLYLALGFLKWYDQRDRERARYAPLLLVPVRLSRHSATKPFKVAYSGEEFGTNLSLQLRLNEQDITLPELPDADDITPSAYAEQVRQVVRGVAGWEVQTNSIVLGFYSFAKLMMYRDLEPDRWPLRGGLRDHPLVRGLLGDGFRGQGSALTPDDTPTDPIIDISTCAHVVDADSSQMLAVQDVQSGRNMVIQGPPGTGKSQTITNLIAAAVRDGKRVLFVAEKMAALNVVKNNLDRVELGHVCLELHSHKAKKKQVLADLEETSQLDAVGHASDGQPADQLRMARDLLNDYVRRIHTALDPSSTTPFAVFGTLARLSGAGITPPDFQLAAAQQWTRTEIEERERAMVRVATHVGGMGVPKAHPWRGCGLDSVLPTDAVRFAARGLELAKAFTDMVEYGNSIAGRTQATFIDLAGADQLFRLGKVLRAAPPVDPNAFAHEVWQARRTEIDELLSTGATYEKSRERLASLVLNDAWEEDVSEIRRLFAEHGGSLFRWLRRDYRTAVKKFATLLSAPLPKPLDQRNQIVNTLVNGQRARAKIRSMNDLGQLAFGKEWRSENSAWIRLRAIDAWERATLPVDLPKDWRTRLAALGDIVAHGKQVGALEETTREQNAHLETLFADLSLDLLSAFGQENTQTLAFAATRDWLGAIGASADRLQQWCTWRVWSQELQTLGLSVLVERLYDGRIDPSRAGDVLLFACYEALARQAYALHLSLAVFDGRSHERVISEFQRVDRERLRNARREVAAAHSEGMPRGERGVGEIGILAREWRKARRHMPLRQLIKTAGRAMQLIKPVWMMSPMSLAQFVEPGALEFDLVLMDEASQIRPVEALGAIGRAKQVVVVGDDMQLPPTSFFERATQNDGEPTDPDEFQAADIESILGLCSAQGIPDRMLRWHYRSQHESLIAVSNLEFYKKLYIPPSAQSDGLGLHLRKVDGVWDRGRSATNRVEARAVARAVVEHARMFGRSERFPAGMSLGVGTFSVAQRDAILDELEVLWRQYPDIAEFFDADAPEPFFVKNLESIQGDERDVIFISVGYGRDETGYFGMSFGPLSTQGGERRLNVLISRARRRCEVFSSIVAADIDLGRAQSVGVRILKTFLQYAETGRLELAQVGIRPIDSDFEEDVGNALAAAGFQIEHQVGVAGFFVDLAVRDPDRPGRYMLGIECDGATYHGSRSARDRDRLREQILRDRGWQIHRIWSTDWFRRRNDELQRAIVAIERARLYTPVVPRAKVERAAALVDTEPPQEPTDTATGAPAVFRPPAPAYVEADFMVRIGVEPHDLRTSSIAEIVTRIVGIEGPIHQDEVGRRFATVCGKDRAGTRIQDAAQVGLTYAKRAGTVHAEKGFYSLAPIETMIPRDRTSARSATLRKPEMLPPVEIRTGLRAVIEDHIGVAPPDAVAEVARLFGFQRTGQELQRVIETELRSLIGDGLVLLKNGNRLYIP